MAMDVNSPLCGDDLEKVSAGKSEGLKGRPPLADGTKSLVEEMAFEQHRLNTKIFTDFTQHACANLRAVGCFLR